MDYLLVGLGNPGSKYKNTRHNIGFDFIDWLAENWDAPQFQGSRHGQAVTTKVTRDGNSVLLAKPDTFMNKSGLAVQSLVDYLDISTNHIMVVHDDVDLEIARLMFIFARSSGGHRGVQSIINQLGTKEFARLRIGITPTDEDGELVKQKVDGGVNPFVMSKFPEKEKKRITAIFNVAAAGIDRWLEEGVEAAMNVVN